MFSKNLRSTAKIPFGTSLVPIYKVLEKIYFFFQNAGGDVGFFIWKKKVIFFLISSALSFFGSVAKDFDVSSFLAFLTSHIFEQQSRLFYFKSKPILLEQNQL